MRTYSTNEARNNFSEMKITQASVTKTIIDIPIWNLKASDGWLLYRRSLEDLRELNSFFSLKHALQLDLRSSSILWRPKMMLADWFSPMSEMSCFFIFSVLISRRFFFVCRDWSLSFVMTSS